MDPSERRAVILEELRRWREEGAVDEATLRALEARYATEDGGAIPPSTGPSARAHPSGKRGAGPRSGFATNALQFVGGLLLGAALVALVLFLDLRPHQQPWVLLLLGGASVAGGLALHAVAPARDGLAEALLAAGFVPLGLAGPFASSGDVSPLVVGLLAAALSVAVHVARRGRGPVVIMAGAAFAIATFAATDAGRFFSDESLPHRLLWLTGLLLYLVLLLAWRRQTWSTVGLALFVLPLTLGFGLVLDAASLSNDSTQMELLLGLWLGALLAIGLVLGNRGLVAGAAAGLTIDAVAFAFDLGGPGTAVVVLLALGGILVWQAELLRGYFGGAADEERL